MTDSPPAARDHFALEALLAEVVVALERTPARVHALWTEFEAALFAHFQHEERSVMTDFLAARPREARSVLEEHRYLRGRIAELRAMVPALPLEAARTFLDELRAHGQHEERVLYRWAESHRAQSRPKAPG